MEYFNRKIDLALQEWRNEERRKPLILRGARQVGKTSAVRNLGKQFTHFVEINFENKEYERVKSIFEQHSDPKIISNELSLFLGTPIVAGETLLFLDEVQSCPDAISSLRFFYEEYPELHVIAAGSLLEFALEELPSFGVGRIDFMFMYPFSFSEFLSATGHEMWSKLIEEASPENPLFDALHGKIVEQLRDFLIIGGMPAVVVEFAKTHNFLRCQEILEDLLFSFRNDFAKYKKRVPSARINEVYNSIAQQAEGKFVYTRVSQELDNVQVKQSLELLLMAGLCYQITHSSADGIPLGARIDTKYRRIIPFDTGLYQQILKLDISDILISNDFDIINKGAVAEIFVGCELKKSVSCHSDRELYCWVREKKNSNAQVDFVIQKGRNIIPIEVKSGTRGQMQSMHVFIEEKKSEYGIRTSLENFSQYGKIKVFPLYAIENCLRNQI